MLDSTTSMSFSCSRSFHAASAAIVASEIGGRVVPADPLALNWMENLRQVAEAFAAALR